jgi:WD40 repeat protein
LKTFTGHKNWVTAVAFAPDGKRAVSLADDFTVRVWDAASGEELDRIDLGVASDTPRSLAFADDGRTLLIGTAGWVVLRCELK